MSRLRLVLVLAIPLAFLPRHNAWTQSKSLSDIIANSRTNLEQAMSRSKELQNLIVNLQSHNEKLSNSLQQQRLISEQQQVTLEELKNSLSRSMTRSAELGRLSESLALEITSLQTQVSRNRLVWRIGIPAALVVGLIGGVYVAGR
jgi:ABC-type phosphate transport system auxiliary subunit